MERREIKKKKTLYLFLSIFGGILFLSFVLATHTVTLIAGSSIDEDTSNIFNISVNNADTLATANITQVDVILPTSFTFSDSSNGTSAGTHTFSNTSSVLTWANDGIVMNLTTEYFWFNATAQTPRSYNITVNTTNSSGTFSTNLAVTVNDTTAPSSITFASPSESDYANLSRSNIVVNVTATDAGTIDTILIRLYNSTKDQINTSSSSTSPNFINFTGLSDGVYYFNATVNDTFGNSNNSATRKVTLDTEDPIITLDSPSNGTSATTTSYNFTFNVSDNVGLASCSVVIDGTAESTSTSISNGTTNGITTSVSTGTHTWYIRCTDYASNQNSSSSRTLIVTSSDDGGGGGGSGDPIYYPGTIQLNSGYTKDYRKNWKMKFEIKNTTHTMNLDSFNYTEESATITVASLPQTRTLSLQNNSFEWKIDVDGDNEYYDLKLTLLKVTLIRATITAQRITELIPENEKGSESNETDKTSDETTNSTSDEDSEDKDASGKSEGLRGYWHALIIFFILVVIAGIAFLIIKKVNTGKKVFGNKIIARRPAMSTPQQNQNISKR